MLSIFHVPVGHLHLFFGRMSIQVFCPFFDWVVSFLILSCMNCPCILVINPSVESFADIFSHSLGCVSILSMDSFPVQKLLSLIRSQLFIFVLISISLGGGSKRILL